MLHCHKIGKDDNTLSLSWHKIWDKVTIFQTFKGITTSQEDNYDEN